MDRGGHRYPGVHVEQMVALPELYVPAAHWTGHVVLVAQA
jgi:hypothetical protein